LNYNIYGVYLLIIVVCTPYYGTVGHVERRVTWRDDVI